jgi:hypothetical protein
MKLNYTTEQNDSQRDDNRLSDALREIIYKKPTWILRNAVSIVATTFILIVGWTWNICYTETISTQITIISSGRNVRAEIKVSDNVGFTFSKGQPIMVKVLSSSIGTPFSFDGKVVRINQTTNSSYTVIVTLIDDNGLNKTASFFQNGAVIEAEVVSKDRRLLEKLFWNVFNTVKPIGS